MAEAWLLLWSCRVALWCAPFPRVLGFARFCAERTSRRRGLASSQAVDVIQRALPLTLRASCLTQALAGWILLTRHGTNVRVKIGVSTSGQRSPEQHGFQAHAWLEENGRVILGDVPEEDNATGLDAFHVIWTLPPE
jgi:hypothetical protein